MGRRSARRTGCTCRARNPLDSLRSGCTGRPGGAHRPSRPRCARRPSGTSQSHRTYRTRKTRRTLSTRCTRISLRTSRARRTRRSRRAGKRQHSPGASDVAGRIDAARAATDRRHIRRTILRNHRISRVRRTREPRALKIKYTVGSRRTGRSRRTLRAGSTIRADGTLQTLTAGCTGHQRVQSDRSIRSDLQAPRVPPHREHPEAPSRLDCLVHLAARPVPADRLGLGDPASPRCWCSCQVVLLRDRRPPAARQHGTEIGGTDAGDVDRSLWR